GEMTKNKEREKDLGVFALILWGIWIAFVVLLMGFFLKLELKKIIEILSVILIMGMISLIYLKWKWKVKSSFGK
ncbi:hypothetical protein COU59_03335, partial [Candidatus Pacearchaeota archaeon CG10_big_fil_rev_8_21_14_0_10_34_12]